MSAFPPFRDWVRDLVEQAGQVGISLDNLPLSAQKIYILEQHGFVVDLETGVIVGMDTDTVALTPAGEALAAIIETGFLDD